MLMTLVGCKDPDDGGNQGGGNITGSLEGIEKEWELVSVNGTPNEFSVYISFDLGMFSMYQQVYSLDFKLYEGEYSISGNKITGSYFEGGDWKCAYVGSVSEDGNTLTLKSDEENAIVCVYKACTIPQQVKDEAFGTRAVDVVPFL